MSSPFVRAKGSSRKGHKVHFRVLTPHTRVSGAGPLRTVGHASGPALESLPRRKPRGGWGPFGERDYGDLRIADGWRARRRRPVTLRVLVGSGDGGRFRWRRCAAARRWHRSKEDWRPRGDIALVFRRVAGGGGDRRCEAGGAATVMRCRSESGFGRASASGAGLRRSRR